MQLFKKQIDFSEFSTGFLKFKETFENFQKKMTLIADIFQKLWIPKNVVR